jgi:hypothetical protein
LPANILFLHAERYQWHNDDPDYDGLSILRKFRFSYLQEKGYLNLRCVWVLGCPNEIRPLTDAVDAAHTQPHAGHFYKQAFEVIFPGRDIPMAVGVSCCAQFAATKEKIQEQPVEYYERIRNLLLRTTLEDSISGRIMEYSWHSKIPHPGHGVPSVLILVVIFGQDPIHCPNASVCYCKMLGLCNLKCTSGACHGRYELPPFATLPEGWPIIGWHGEQRKLGVPG